MELKINGIENIKNILKGLDKPLRDKILKKSLQLLAKPILESAESKV